MNGFFHFHEVTVFLARKANRAEINEIIKAVSGATKRAFPEIPMHVKVNIRWVNSDFKFSPIGEESNKKNIPEIEKGDRDRNDRKTPQGFNRRPVPAQL
jgi:hypothetical protein